MSAGRSRRLADPVGFAAVLASAKAGERGAFEQLFTALRGRVLAFVRVRGASDPEGMVNEVFSKVFAGLGGFEGNEVQFAAWVLRIARNTMIDEARRLARRPRETSIEGVPIAESWLGVGDVEAEALGRLGDDWVVWQVARLTPEQRDVVVLRVVADLTIDAIAEVTGRRVGAVKGLQRRAFRTLVRNLECGRSPRLGV